MTTITPTAEQIRIAELNGWDPQELAENNARVNRVHELTRKNSKAQLLCMVLAAGTQGLHHPSTWTKGELASEVEHLERVKAQQR